MRRSKSSSDPGQALIHSQLLVTRAQRAFRLAMREARALKRSEVGPELLFLGLILEGNGVAARVLKDLHINTESARHEIIRQLTR
ncbi:MAG TPA: Clp protease N-terminal domain-containing protein [Verrucomicrobiae bacterium]|jgi:ATP-dependent Clp protease ATP-binding subunit ClpC|nr:Clp protease N-terminal domain-containing protein [Verrucomicrobiae bacterium]